jgi:hypothetical protein
MKKLRLVQSPFQGYLCLTRETISSPYIIVYSGFSLTSDRHIASCHRDTTQNSIQTPNTLNARTLYRHDDNG